MKHLFAFSLFLVSAFSHAQSVCDSLDVVSIQYSPFTDTVIVVSVENNNQMEILDYPGFVLLNANADTVAVETVNYFGIGSESIHLLDVRAGIHDPLSNFEGTLQLYSDFYGTFECEWNLDQSLCASSPCESAIIGFQNFGGALVLGDFHWSIEDELEMVVDSGSFSMVAEEQFWLRDVCLEPGNYTYHLTALTQPSGGGPTLTVQNAIGFNSPSVSAPLDWFNDPTAQLAFPFYPFCAQLPNSIENVVDENDILVLRNGSDVVLESQHVMKKALIYCMAGKLVASMNPHATRFTLLTDITYGVYLVQVQTEQGWSLLKIAH